MKTAHMRQIGRLWLLRWQPRQAAETSAVLRVCRCTVITKVHSA